MYNILIGGTAGDGIETISSLLEKILQKKGYHFFAMRDFMSRVRGGHNFTKLRFGKEPITTHRDALDILIALNKESYLIHKDYLKPEGFILHDTSTDIEDKRAIKLELKNTAKQLGNIKLSGTIAIGALLKIFDIDIENAQTIIATVLRQDLIEANITALKAGFALTEKHFEPIKPIIKDNITLTGAKAMALGALAANTNFYSAYPMSPSTTLLDYFTAQSDFLNVAVEQAEDEIAAINMALGASYAGARAMTGTSGGGFSLMVEGLGFAGIAEIPIVIADIQRPGPATGLPTRTEQSDLKFVINASQGEFPRMVIAVKNHTDAFYQTARAVELAQKYQIPVIILSDQYLADSTTNIPNFNLNKIYKTNPLENHSEKEDYYTYKITASGISPRLTPGSTEHVVCIDSDEHDEYGHITEDAYIRTEMVDKRMRKLELLEKELIEPQFIGDENFTTLFVGFGTTHSAIAEAIEILNTNSKEKYAALTFSDIYPLPTKSLKQYAKKAKELINIEQNATGQLASLIRETTLINCHKSILKYDGRQISVDDILLAITTDKTKEI